jgi:hypothetical protein
MPQTVEEKLRSAIEDILEEMADYVNRLGEEKSAEMYHDAKGELDYKIFLLVKEISKRDDSAK